MKNLFLSITFLIIYSIGYSQENQYRNDECLNRNLTFQNIDESNILDPYIIDDDSHGVIDLHPFAISDIGSINSLTNALVTDSNITFEVVMTEPSRLFNGYYIKYKQLYKNIPVSNGGLTIRVVNDDNPASAPTGCIGCPPPLGPCDLVHSVAPSIYENINLSATPTIAKTSLANYISGQNVQITNAELIIVNNLVGNCDYKLTWRVIYSTDTLIDQVAWIDAHSGQTLFTHYAHNMKDAPTTDYGPRNMIDQVDGSETELRNDRLAVHDMSDITGVTQVRQLRSSFDNNQIPRSPTSRDWIPSDASTDVFQVFWMAEDIIDEFEQELGIVFEDVHIGVHPSAGGAISFFIPGGGIPSEQALFAIGADNATGLSLAEFDVIAHELAHAIIRVHFNSMLLEGATLHEGIADMIGTFIESELEPGGLDWQMGDNVPSVIRDLENTTRNCFTTIDPLTVSHDRSEALGHWFYLCVNGDPLNNTTPINIKEMIELVLEALPQIGDNPDYPDLMQATIDIAESLYGSCSSEFNTILQSWEKICVATGHRLASPNEPCVEISGPNTVCEENNTFSVCTNFTGLNSSAGKWTIIGRNSTSFQSVQGMNGNSQQGGSCLDISHIPDMPYYPQTITVQYYNPLTGETITKKIKIIDCDGDDPTCDEYYNNNNSPNVVNLESFVNKEKEDKSVEVQIFDIMGRKLNIQYEDLLLRNSSTLKIVILTYWDKGKLIKTEKRIIN